MGAKGKMRRTDYPERHVPDKAAGQRLEEATRIQHETGISYGEQQARRYLNKTSMPDRHFVKVGKKLDDRIGRYPFSRRSLSRYCCMDDHWLYDCLAGRTRMDRKALERICKVLECEPEDVMED